MKGRTVSAIAIGVSLAVATAWCATIWADGFETYPVGQLPPNPPWVASGNTSNCYVDGSVSYEGTKSLHLYGVVGGTWGAHQHHLIGTAAPYQIEYMVRTGDEVIPPYGHYAYSDLELRTGPSWTYPGRSLLSFRKDGLICGVPGPLRQFNKLQWYRCRVKYERPNASTVRITYRIDDDLFGPYDTPAFSFENDLTWMSLIANAGTAWYDAVSITTPAVNPEPTLLAVPYYNQDATPWCLPTSLSMVLKYFGVNRKPAWVAKDLGLSNDWLGVLIWQLLGDQYPKLRDYLQNEYGHPSEKSDFDSFDEFQDYVIGQVRSSRRPLLIGANLGLGDGGHAFVVMGVSDDSLYVNDPSGALLQYMYNEITDKKAYGDYLTNKVARGIAWSDFQTFYNTRTRRVVFADLAPVPQVPSAVSLDVLPSCGVFFQKPGRGCPCLS